MASQVCNLSGSDVVRFSTPFGTRDFTTTAARTIAAASGTQEQLETALQNPGEWVTVPNVTTARGLRPRNYAKFAA